MVAYVEKDGGSPERGHRRPFLASVDSFDSLATSDRDSRYRPASYFSPSPLVTMTTTDPFAEKAAALVSKESPAKGAAEKRASQELAS